MAPGHGAPLLNEPDLSQEEPKESAQPSPPPASGLLWSLGGVLATLAEMLFGRVELLLLDMQEGIESLASVLLWAFIGLLAAGLALFVGAMALIFAFWDTHRLLVSLSVMGAFLLIALGAALAVRARLRSQRQLFATSLEEFTRDREFFRTRL
jgi:uncharacterized membrane protein YqjE